MRDQGGYLESINEIPEPHAFTVQLRIGQGDYSAFFEEHEHAHGAASPSLYPPRTRTMTMSQAIKAFSSKQEAIEVGYEEGSAPRKNGANPKHLQLNRELFKTP
jgi:hypothetical protein